MSRRLALIAAVLAVTLPAGGCGGEDEEPSPRTTASTSTAATTSTSTSPEPAGEPPSSAVYAAKMKPIAVELERRLDGADLKRNRRDFDRGVALLRARKRMARITADPALLLAHDRLAKAIAVGGTSLIAQPGSEYAKQVRRAGGQIGTRSAVVIVAPELNAWAGETAAKIEGDGAEAPAWLDRVRRSARDLTTEAGEALP
jgi:hypothetical protein